jgi:acyl carrier protein
MNENTMKVKEWIISKAPSIGDLDPDLNIIEQGVIESLQFLELVFLIEQLSGKKIDMSEVSISNFHTLNAIEESFF